MMRQPTSNEAQYRFWRRSVAGERVERFEDEPQPGFYKRRYVRGGPFVPVEIWLEQQIDPETGELTADEQLRAVCNGERCNPYTVWTYCRAITLEEYDALTGARDAIADMAATHVAINLADLAPIRP